MRCHVERGYGNLTPCGSTRWVRVKRHAIHHRGSSVHRRLVENILLIVTDLCTVSQYSISLRTYTIWHHDVCHWSVLTWLWCIGQFYILFWILLEFGTSYCLSWRYLHWLDIEFVYCVFDTRKLILSKWWEHTAETLGEEFNLAGSIWWEKLLHFEFGLWDALALWGQWPYLVILFVQEFCDEMFRYCEDNTYIIVIVIYGSYIWSYGVHFIVPEKTLVISMRTTLFWDDFGLHCGLAITVVERLQRYNCIWLMNYIDNVEQNILFYIEVWSCEMLSLCGKLIWRRNVAFWLCFAYRRRLYRYLMWITSFLRSQSACD